MKKDKKAFIVARKEFDRLSEDSMEKQKLKHQLGRCERWLARKSEFEQKYIECLNVREDLQILLMKHMISQVIVDFETIMEDFKQLPFTMKKEKAEIRICEWLIEALSLLTGFKRAGSETWKSCLSRAQIVFAQVVPNDFLLEKISSQLILFEKLQAALKELHLVEKVVDKMEDKEREKLRTLEEVERLKEALDSCQVEMEEERSFVTKIHEKARTIKLQLETFKVRKQKTNFQEYQTISEEIRRLPFQIPEEQSVRRLVRRSLKLSDKLKSSEKLINSENLAEALELYKQQSICFPECERILESFESSKRALEEAEDLQKEDASSHTYKSLKQAYYKLEDRWEGPLEEKFKAARLGLFSLLVELLRRVWENKGNYFVSMPFEEFLQIENESRLLKEKYGSDHERFKRSCEFLKEVKQKAEEKKLEILGLRRKEDFLAVLRGKKKKTGFISWINEITEGLMKFGHKGTFQIEVEEGYSNLKSFTEILMDEEKNPEEPAEQGNEEAAKPSVKEKSKNSSATPREEKSSSDEKAREIKKRRSLLKTLRTVLEDNKNLKISFLEINEVSLQLANYIGQISETSPQRGEQVKGSVTDLLRKIARYPGISKKLVKKKFDFDFISTLRSKSESFLEELEKRYTCRAAEEPSGKVRKKLKKNNENAEEIAARPEAKAEQLIKKKEAKYVEKQSKKHSQAEGESKPNEKDDVMTFFSGELTPSTGSFSAHVSLTTSKKNEAHIRSFPFSSFSELKVKGYVDVNVFEAFMNKILINRNKKTVYGAIFGGFVSSFDGSVQSILDKYAEMQKNHQRLSVIEWSTQSKVYLLHPEQYNSAWRGQTNLVDNDISQLCFIFLHKNKAPVNRSELINGERSSEVLEEKKRHSDSKNRDLKKKMETMALIRQKKFKDPRINNIISQSEHLLNIKTGESERQPSQSQVILPAEKAEAKKKMPAEEAEKSESAIVKSYLKIENNESISKITDILSSMNKTLDSFTAQMATKNGESSPSKKFNNNFGPHGGNQQGHVQPIPLLAQLPLPIFGKNKRAAQQGLSEPKFSFLPNANENCLFSEQPMEFEKVKENAEFQGETRQGLVPARPANLNSDIVKANAHQSMAVADSAQIEEEGHSAEIDGRSVHARGMNANPQRRFNSSLRPRHISNYAANKYQSYRRAVHDKSEPAEESFRGGQLNHASVSHDQLALEEAEVPVKESWKSLGTLRGLSREFARGRKESAEEATTYQDENSRDRSNMFQDKDDRDFYEEKASARITGGPKRTYNEMISNRFDANRFEAKASKFEANRFEAKANKFEARANKFEANKFEAKANKFEANKFEAKANKFEANKFEANQLEANQFEANQFEANKFEANKSSREGSFEFNHKSNSQREAFFEQNHKSGMQQNLGMQQNGKSGMQREAFFEQNHKSNVQREALFEQNHKTSMLRDSFFEQNHKPMRKEGLLERSNKHMGAQNITGRLSPKRVPGEQSDIYERNPFRSISEKPRKHAESSLEQVYRENFEQHLMTALRIPEEFQKTVYPINEGRQVIRKGANKISTEHVDRKQIASPGFDSVFARKNQNNVPNKLMSIEYETPIEVFRTKGSTVKNPFSQQPSRALYNQRDETVGTNFAFAKGDARRADGFAKAGSRFFNKSDDTAPAAGVSKGSYTSKGPSAYDDKENLSSSAYFLDEDDSRRKFQYSTRNSALPIKINRNF